MQLSTAAARPSDSSHMTIIAHGWSHHLTESVAQALSESEIVPYHLS